MVRFSRAGLIIFQASKHCKCCTAGSAVQVWQHVPGSGHHPIEALFDADLASISSQCEETDCGEEFFLNNAFLSFPAYDAFLYELMHSFVAEFNGNIWGWNGPRLISSLYKRLLCDTSEGLLSCHKMKVLPHEQLAPFDWDEIMPVLGSQPDEAYTLLTNNPQMLAIHAYHNVWKHTCILHNPVFHNIMSDHCPFVSATHKGSIYCKQQT